MVVIHSVEKRNPGKRISEYSIYILASQRNETLYAGFTSSPHPSSSFGQVKTSLISTMILPEQGARIVLTSR